MKRDFEFTLHTQREAWIRQNERCGSCGEPIISLGDAGRAAHRFGESAQAHHMHPIKPRPGMPRPTRQFALDSVDNCVILCRSCHYSAHEGGNYRFGTVISGPADYPHFYDGVKGKARDRKGE